MFNRRLLLQSALAASALFVSGCVSTRGRLVPGSFAWFDLVSNDPDAARAFYAGLFGWQFGAPASDGYRLISGGGEVLGGLVASSDVDAGSEFSSQWVPVLSVTDVVQATNAATANGGKLVRSPFTTSAGTFSTVRDSRGALLVLYTGTEGFPLDAEQKLNTWNWADLLTDDPGRANAFYKAVAGMEMRRDGEQIVFLSGGRVRGGVVQISRSRIEPTWLPYVAVSDVRNTARRSQELGGGPLTITDDAAILLDPTGAAIGVAQIGGSA